ncbi:MAG: SMC-Scp complex subunit ScpB [Evtepia gabavorous]
MSRGNRGGVRLVPLEESWQLVSAPQWGDHPGACCPGASRTKLSPAASGRPWRWWRDIQPVTRDGLDVDQVRGVDSAHSLALLLDRELVAPCGSLDAPGRPILYRTTPVFLRSFGLSSLEELPPLPESGLNREEGQPW